MKWPGILKLFRDEELFLTQNSFSQEILQPNFSIDSILDAIEGNDEPAPQNSCAEGLKKIVPDESIKGGPKAVRVVLKTGILKPNPLISIIVLL